jgi:hypothetical protein
MWKVLFQYSSGTSFDLLYYKTFGLFGLGTIFP